MIDSVVITNLLAVRFGFARRMISNCVHINFIIFLLPARKATDYLCYPGSSGGGGGEWGPLLELTVQIFPSYLTKTKILFLLYALMLKDYLCNINYNYIYRNKIFQNS